MVLHYAQLAADAGGVDAFLIGSELRGADARALGLRRLSGGDALVDAGRRREGDRRRRTRSSPTAPTGPSTARMWSTGANEVRFPLDPLWASPSIDAVGIDYYAPLADWRDGADHLDRALATARSTTATISPAICAAARATTGTMPTTRRAPRRRARRSPTGSASLGVPQSRISGTGGRNAHYERVGGVELASPTGWVPQSKPIWLTELGCPAVDKGANQPSVFPDPKSSESGVPYFSTGARDDLIQRRMLEAVLRTFDPAFGATTATIRCRRSMAGA